MEIGTRRRKEAFPPSFVQGALHFHFAPSLMKHVAGCGWPQTCWRRLFIFTRLPDDSCPFESEIAQPSDSFQMCLMLRMPVKNIAGGSEAQWAMGLLPGVRVSPPYLMIRITWGKFLKEAPRLHHLSSGVLQRRALGRYISNKNPRWPFLLGKFGKISRNDTLGPRSFPKCLTCICTCHLSMHPGFTSHTLDKHST